MGMQCCECLLVCVCVCVCVNSIRVNDSAGCGVSKKKWICLPS
jgi:hypothetical protein